MAIVSKSKASTFLMGISALFLAGLLGLTYFLSSHNKTTQNQNQSSSEDFMIEALSPSNSPTTAEQATPTEEPVANNESSTGANKVSPGQSATSNSHTSINISNTNNQVNTTVSLKISEDGCKVEANGPSGTQLIIDTKNGTKGGHQEYTLDGSPKTVSSGGMLAGMSVEAKLIDPSGDIRATSSSTIGSAGCS